MSDQNRTTNPLAGEVFEVFARRKPEDPLHPGKFGVGVYARSIYDEWAWIEMVVVPRAAITTVVET